MVLRERARLAGLALMAGLALGALEARAQQTTPVAPAPAPASQPAPRSPANAEIAPSAPATPAPGAASQPTPPAASAADDIAEAFSKVGKELYEECIFELSEEQVEVQAALIEAYIGQGADGAVARKLAAQQIQPPKLPAKCEQLRRSPAAAPPETSAGWEITLALPKAIVEPKPIDPKAAAPKPADPKLAAKPDAKPAPSVAAKQPADKSAPLAALASKSVLQQWDCASDVDFVTVHINGYARKLTGGEICNSYEDVVREVPASLASFRLGYTIKTGRLFVVSDDASANGQTITWAISGRDVCRNNPDPDCLAARAVGPLPPGEYTFAAGKDQRVSWGPRTKRNVAGIYLKKLWNKDRFTREQTAAILSRHNIAMHVRLKGEMSEACLGLEPKGWAYVAGLIKDGRTTGLNVYIDEPHPQVAETPPLVRGSSFSLTSLFK